MITIENWLELAKAKDPKRFIYFVNTDCAAPSVNPEAFEDCEYCLQSDMRGNYIQDIFNHFYDVENWFLTREEAEQWLAGYSPLWSDPNEEVWVVTEKYEVRKVPMKKVPFHESYYSTKEEAEEKAEGYNKSVENIWGC